MPNALRSAAGVLVDPTGTLVAQTGLGGPAVLQGTVPLRRDTTVYTRVGDAPMAILALLTLTIAWLGALRRLPRGGN
jgi:apolipoprotein N-acyltransferase